MRASRKKGILALARLVVAGYLEGRSSLDHAVAAVNKLELFVVRANIARFARLLGMANYSDHNPSTEAIRAIFVLERTNFSGAIEHSSAAIRPSW